MSSSSRSPISLDEPIDSRRETKAVVRQRQNRRERLLLLLAAGAVVLAWFYGYFTSGADVAPLVPKVLPGAVSVTIQGDLFVGSDDAGQIIGYAATATAPGYGGPIDVLVGVDPTGVVLGVEIVAERESPGFFRLVTSSDLVAEYTGRAMTDPLRLGDDLDAVTGATVSSEGVANGVRAAVRTVAAEALATALPPEATPIEFGAPEIVLILLFVAGYVGHRIHKPVLKKRIRWATLLGGLIFLGFIYTAPLTITMIASLLSGYWPDWHSNLYWYLLIGGILFVTTVEAKNPYCSWFCPFGAFQECMAAVSGAKVYRPRTLSDGLKWVQRGLSLTAILLGLALRRPGVAGYEPFATLFDLRGSMVQWALLIIVVLASLVMYRPFCNYLCPMDPVIDIIAATRRWIKETWSSWRAKPANP
ncbi:MAG: FMN-binding protein [Caldilineaceae bacterium]|nr:FMN-binding protein [Caldilineaceae bacterium]MBP8106340.1 FMN-binding protein [Caldilineaceae bacterium]MBP8125055.1 FMN-binding protein [Caldilineaceae bacterium]MBP9074839.1 FMN-binding protein [Caldilineaceae bacterium]